MKGIWGALAVLVACNADTQAGSPSKADAARSDDAQSAAVVDAESEADAYPPPMACDMDASAEASVTMCPPPISVCAVGQGTGITYFDWGQCVAGWCTWTTHFTPCPSGNLCFSGACQSGPTM